MTAQPAQHIGCLTMVIWLTKNLCFSILSVVYDCGICRDNYAMITRSTRR
jgi:hypothetical protein